MVYRIGGACLICAICLIGDACLIGVICLIGDACLTRNDSDRWCLFDMCYMFDR